MQQRPAGAPPAGAPQNRKETGSGADFRGRRRTISKADQRSGGEIFYQGLDYEARGCEIEGRESCAVQRSVILILPSHKVEA